MPTPALGRCPQIEVNTTDASRLARRFRFANLPTGATLDSFNHDHASGIDQNLLAELATCRQIDTISAADPTAAVALRSKAHGPL